MLTESMVSRSPPRDGRNHLPRQLLLPWRHNYSAAMPGEYGIG